MSNSLLNSLMANVKPVVALTSNKPAKVEKEPREKVATNPDNGADVRIFASGKVYPSAEFATQYGLEYTPQIGNTVSNGIDLFNALDWPNYTNAGNTTPLLLGYAYPMSEKKVELFAGIRYNEDGTPKNSVMTQGTILPDATLNLIATGLGYNESTTAGVVGEDAAIISAWRTLLGDKRFIDLKFNQVGGLFDTPDGKYMIPKQVEKGPKKNEVTLIKRQKISIMVVTLFAPEEEANEVTAIMDDTTKEGIAQDAGDDISSDHFQDQVETPEGESKFDDLLAVHKQFEPQVETAE